MAKRISNDLLDGIQEKRRKPDYFHYKWFKISEYTKDKLKEMGCANFKTVVKEYINNIKNRCEKGKEPYEFATAYTNSYENGDIRVNVLGYKIEEERKII